jgi:hypothetical protein
VARAPRLHGFASMLGGKNAWRCAYDYVRNQSFADPELSVDTPERVPRRAIRSDLCPSGRPAAPSIPRLTGSLLHAEAQREGAV